METALMYAPQIGFTLLIVGAIWFEVTIVNRAKVNMFHFLGSAFVSAIGVSILLIISVLVWR